MRLNASATIATGIVAQLVAASNGHHYPPSQDIWQVEPPINNNDKLYAGWEQIDTIKHLKVYDGVDEGRTYAHHSELFSARGRIYLMFSSAPVDEDSMGQDARIVVSKNNGLSWSPSEVAVPAAMLPNQTNAHNFSYWCDREISQRPWQPISFVHLLENDHLYAVAQSVGITCPNPTQAAGRVAQLVDVDGKPIGDPCWLEKNEYTKSQLYSHTIYGTKFGMKNCKEASKINAILKEPQKVPAWSTWLYNHRLYAIDGQHNMQEQTHSVWTHGHNRYSNGYWQRFWRDISPENNSLAVWVEYNTSPAGNGWYPKKLQQYGNKIYKTNIPDAKTKQHLGTLQGTGDRFLISNPRYDPALARQPLTIATSRGRHNYAYEKIGVLRTNASTIIAPETRDQYKNLGFHYPSAIQVGERLIVAYSENKENIWVSIIDVEQLP